MTENVGLTASVKTVDNTGGTGTPELNKVRASVPVLRRAHAAAVQATENAKVKAAKAAQHATQAEAAIPTAIAEENKAAADLAAAEQRLHELEN